MPNGFGPMKVRDQALMTACARDAGSKRHIAQEDWEPPALYARCRWPTGDFSYVLDEQLQFALHVTQLWVRAIRHARADQRMSLRSLSGRTGATVNTLSELELGARWPSLPVLLRVSAVLDVDVRVLVGP